MRILHVITSLDPSTGGPPRVAVRLAAGQAALGHAVTVATTDRIGDPAAFEGMTRRLPAFDRVRIAQLGEASGLERYLGRRTRTALRPLIAASDVVHIHSVWSTLNRVAADEAHRAGKPYFLQPNDMLNPYSLSLKRWKKGIALALGYRRMIERAYALLFGHSEECRLVQTVGFRTRHLVAALGGVFREEVEPLPAPGGFYDRHPEVGGSPFVVFLSRLHPKKGLDYLAEGFAVAARRVPGAHLVVVGHDEGARADFERRIAGHGLTHRVHLVGPMHSQDKWQTYRDAACFCLPSRDEAFTVAIIEALAASLPVVISKTCHFDDVAEYEAGFTVDLTPEAIGDALARLLTDRGLRDRASANARRLFLERLDFANTARQTLAHYEQALAPAGVPAAVPGA